MKSGSVKPLSTELSVVQLSVFAHLFMSIAEQMGRALQRTAISTNIKVDLFPFQSSLAPLGSVKPIFNLFASLVSTMHCNRSGWISLVPSSVLMAAW